MQNNKCILEINNHQGHVHNNIQETLLSMSTRPVKHMTKIVPNRLTADHQRRKRERKHTLLHKSSFSLSKTKRKEKKLIYKLIHKIYTINGSHAHISFIESAEKNIHNIKLYKIIITNN